MAEDEKKIDWDGENLDSNGEDQKTSYSLEEVEEMKKKWFDTDPGTQKLLQSKKTYETVLDEVWKVADDKKHLIDLYEDSPDVAKIILDRYYEWQSIEDFKTSINYKVDVADPKVIARMVQKEAKIMADTKLISEQKAEFITKLKMTDEEVKDFDEAFNERIQLKSFKLSNLDKHFEKAYRDVNDNTESLKEMKKQQAIAEAQASWDGKGWKQVTGQKESTLKKNSNYNKSFLKEQWIL